MSRHYVGRRWPVHVKMCSTAVRPSIHRLICPSVHRLIRPSVRRFICPSVHRLIRPSVHRLIRPSVHRLIRPSIHRLIRPSVHRLIRPSVIFVATYSAFYFSQQTARSWPSSQPIRAFTCRRDAPSPRLSWSTCSAAREEASS